MGRKSEWNQWITDFEMYVTEVAVETEKEGEPPEAIDSLGFTWTQSLRPAIDRGTNS